jgi:ElaA protein
MGEPSIHTSRFIDLDAATLYELLRLRGDVFVVEQACAYADLDGRDTEPSTVHCWIDVDGAPAAVLRLLSEPDGAARLGRIATSSAHRGQGLADALVRHAVALAGAVPVVLDAQSHLVDWYRGLGFVVDGAEFVEDGIPHTPMRLAR